MVTATKPSNFGKNYIKIGVSLSFHACPTDTHGKFKSWKKSNLFNACPQTTLDIRGFFFQQNKKKIIKEIPRMFIGHQWFNF